MRSGADWRFPESVKRSDEERSVYQHTMVNVYREIMIQLAMDFPGVPIRDLTIGQMRFWYEGLRKTLHKRTASKK